MRGISLLILALYLAGCASMRRDSDIDAVSISFEKGGGMTVAPAYKVTLTRDGLVKFELEGLSRREMHTKHIGRGAAERIFVKAQEIGFLALKDDYFESREVTPGDPSVIELPPTDLPTRTIILRTSTRVKRVDDYWGAPRSLVDLEQMICHETGVSEWLPKPK